MASKKTCFSFFPLIMALLFAGGGLFGATTASYAAENSAVILMYHRFGEEQHPSTNITIEQFEAQLAELKEEKYNIVPLDTIITAFQNKADLPPRTIAITIDDAFLSILENAWPRLKAANFPFTLFVSTEPVTQEIGGYMTWQQIRELSRDPLVSIGHHAHSHEHLMLMTPEEVSRDIEKASEIFKKELNYIPDIFAYPFGEYSHETKNIIQNKGFKAALAQYSSAASSFNDQFALPRFAFNEKYSTLSRFQLIANSRALPAKDILPIDPGISENPPHIGFTIEKDIPGLQAMSCYPSHLGKAAEIHRVGSNRIEIRFDAPFPEGRNRVNCTMPGPDKRWYWFGLPFFVK